MKDFSHPDSDAMEPADIHRLITTTLTVSRSAWRPVAEVVTDFDRSMPLVPCFVKDLNQVLLNLVVNAAQAMAPVPGSESTGKGTLHVSTLLNAEVAEIRISDTGSGIPRDLHHRIFEPFFTTKEVGKGTGQGLYMAHSTIVKKHQGTLTFDSTPGGGTTFIIGLPLQPVA
jgi:signal transduction histidine kinase